MSTMPRGHHTLLLSEEELASRIRQLGSQITRDYAGRRLTLIGILKGSVPFLADLAREIRLPVHFDYLEVSSYEGTSSSGVVRFLKDLSHPIEGEHVLIVEDIVDTGLTLAHLQEVLATRAPASVKVCCLLDKPAGRKMEMEADYVGFTIDPLFVVGYGMDLDGYFRNLPYVAVWHPENA